MNQMEHVQYTRYEWTNVPVFVNIINYLKDKDIKFVADIGSNVGEVSKIFLENIPSILKIYAYEPQSENFNFLKTRFLEESKIQPIKKGIFYGKSSANLVYNGGCGSFTIAKNDSAVCENIDLVEIENENIEKLDLVKLDIEGAEYNVLQNSSLLKSVKYLIIEFHPFGMDDFQQYYENLPPVGPEHYNERCSYLLRYELNWIYKNLPNYKVIISDTHCQYLLELID